MLRQATVEDVANRRITRLHGRIVVVTHYYPRFLKSNLIHEYTKALAPSKELLTEFKNREKESGNHDQAFDDVEYQSKFWLSDEGFTELQKLSIEAQTSQVYLVCHCAIGTRCHRELLMVLAQQLYQAPIAKLSFPWDEFKARLT